MNRFKTRLIISLFSLLILCTFTISSGQTVGKIFDADFANKAFGEVVSSVQIDNSSLESMAQSAGSYIMFNIDNGSVRSLDGSRNSVQGEATSKTEVFYKFSTSQVEALLASGGQNSSWVEMRPETLTITNGDYTLEMSDPCPPHCD